MPSKKQAKQANQAKQSKIKYDKMKKEKEGKQCKPKGKNFVPIPTQSISKEKRAKPIEQTPKIRSFFATLSQESEIKDTIPLDLDAWNNLEKCKADNQEAKEIDCEKTKQSYCLFPVTLNDMRFVFFKLREGSCFNKVTFNDEESCAGISHFQITGDIPRSYKKNPKNYINALVDLIAQNPLEDITNCEIIYQHESQGASFIENFKTHFQIIETKKALPYQLEGSSFCKFNHQKEEKRVSQKNNEGRKSLPSTENSENGSSESEKESAQKEQTKEDAENDAVIDTYDNSEWSNPLKKGKGKKGNNKKQNLISSVIVEANQKNKSKGTSEIVVSKKGSKIKNHDSFIPSENGKPLGLPNIGNTCYMNSALQNIFHTPELSEWFCNEKNKDSFKNGGLAEKLTALWELKKVVPKADSLLEEIYSFKQSISSLSPEFDDNNQHDALELFKMLLGGLSEELNSARGKNVYRMLSFNPEISDEENAEEYFKYMRERETSIITSTFGGQLLNVVKCKVCRNEKKTCDEYWSLPLCFRYQKQIDANEPESTKVSRKKGKHNKNKQQNPDNRIKETVKIEDMLRQFTDNEDIQTKLSCDVCGNDEDHTTGSKILRLPNVLVIAIKRFRQTKKGFAKENACISFPTKELDVKEFTQGGHESLNDTKYELFGLINHNGSLDSGHYTAECVDQKDKCWYKFNDANVKKIEDKSARSSRLEDSDAYMLFYVKSSCLTK